MQDGGALARIETVAAEAAERSPVPTPPPRPLSPLNGRAKAAIVVRLLLKEGADLPLEDLPEDLQAILTQQIGRMGLVDRDTLAAVVHEFAEALDGVALTFPGTLAGAVSELEGWISAQTAARLRKEAGIRAAGDPWARLRAVPVDDLADIVQSESVEVAAVLLSKLDTARAAELLGRLPGPLARRIAFAVSRTGNVTPQTVERIGIALAGQLENRPQRAFEDEPGKRIGEILNLSTSSTRNELLDALEQTDADFASSVRKAIFTFAHIPARLDPRDVPKVVRAVDPDDLVKAIAFAGEGENREAAEFLLSNISSRMADNLREEAAEKGTVQAREGEAALAAVAAAIRDLRQSGEIALRSNEADAEEA